MADHPLPVMICPLPVTKTRLAAALHTASMTHMHTQTLARARARPPLAPPTPPLPPPPPTHTHIHTLARGHITRVAETLSNQERTPSSDEIFLGCSSASSSAYTRICPPRERKIRGSIPACAEIFPGRVIPVTLKNKKLAPQWLPCQAPGVTGPVLGRVGPVSVYCDWVRWKVGSATSISVWQHEQLSEQIRP